jgi:hypothetical protein
MKERIRPFCLLGGFIEAVAISWALLYVGEYFGWHWVREAGGVVLGTVL